MNFWTITKLFIAQLLKCSLIYSCSVWKRIRTWTELYPLSKGCYNYALKHSQTLLLLAWYWSEKLSLKKKKLESWWNKRKMFLEMTMKIHLKEKMEKDHCHMTWIKDNHCMLVLKRQTYGNWQYLKTIIIQQWESSLNISWRTNKSHIQVATRY